MELALLGIGLVLVIEGLVLALMPNRLDRLVRAVASWPLETRRAFGLGALAVGVLLIWLARS